MGFGGLAGSGGVGVGIRGRFEGLRGVGLVVGAWWVQGWGGVWGGGCSDGVDVLVGGCDEGGGGPGGRYSEGGLSAVAGDDPWYVP